MYAVKFCLAQHAPLKCSIEMLALVVTLLRTFVAVDRRPCKRSSLGFGWCKRSSLGFGWCKRSSLCFGAAHIHYCCVLLSLSPLVHPGRPGPPPAAARRKRSRATTHPADPQECTYAHMRGARRSLCEHHAMSALRAFALHAQCGVRPGHHRRHAAVAVDAPVAVAVEAAAAAQKRALGARQSWPSW
jgi:hypothetical protein